MWCVCTVTCKRKRQGDSECLLNESNNKVTQNSRSKVIFVPSLLASERLLNINNLPEGKENLLRIIIAHPPCFFSLHASEDCDNIAGVCLPTEKKAASTQQPTQHHHSHHTPCLHVTTNINSHDSSNESTSKPVAMAVIAVTCLFSNSLRATVRMIEVTSLHPGFHPLHPPSHTMISTQHGQRRPRCSNAASCLNDHHSSAAAGR